MDINVRKTGLQEIIELRKLFLQENNVQFIHNKCHLYGWADTYLFTLRDQVAGYGAVWGRDKREDRDAIFEFYVLPPFRKLTSAFFTAFRNTAGTRYIECQTNLPLLAAMFFEHASGIYAEAILFEDHFLTHYLGEGMVFQQKEKREDENPNDRACVIRQQEEVIAAGGLMLNYNWPFADIYYEVNEQYRNRGVATFMVQELKKVAYAMGRVPAARCNVRNAISKATLFKAGMRVCGYLLQGELK